MNETLRDKLITMINSKTQIVKTVEEIDGVDTIVSKEITGIDKAKNVLAELSYSDDEITSMITEVNDYILANEAKVLQDGFVDKHLKDASAKLQDLIKELPDLNKLEDYAKTFENDKKIFAFGLVWSVWFEDEINYVKNPDGSTKEDKQSVRHTAWELKHSFVDRYTEKAKTAKQLTEKDGETKRSDSEYPDGYSAWSAFVKDKLPEYFKANSLNGNSLNKGVNGRRLVGTAITKGAIKIDSILFSGKAKPVEFYK
jgi:hypothetical protein